MSWNKFPWSKLYFYASILERERADHAAFFSYANQRGGRLQKCLPFSAVATVSVPKIKQASLCLRARDEAGNDRLSSHTGGRHRFPAMDMCGDVVLMSTSLLILCQVLICRSAKPKARPAVPRKWRSAIR